MGCRICSSRADCLHGMGIHRFPATIRRSPHQRCTSFNFGDNMREKRGVQPEKASASVADTRVHRRMGADCSKRCFLRWHRCAAVGISEDKFASSGGHGGEKRKSGQKRGAVSRHPGCILRLAAVHRRRLQAGGKQLAVGHGSIYDDHPVNPSGTRVWAPGDDEGLAPAVAPLGGNTYRHAVCVACASGHTVHGRGEKYGHTPVAVRGCRRIFIT